MKITIDRSLLEQALEALKDNREDVSRGESSRYMVQHYDPTIAALREALAQPQQEPVFWYRPRSDGRYEGPIHNAMVEKVRRESGVWMPLYTSPSASTATSEGVLVPIGILEAAEISLGSFCSDEGWSGQDMQTMDNLSAYIAKHKAAHGIKETS